MFGPKDETLILNILGQGGVDELKKFELIKINTNTAVDHEELRTALNIVPKVILGWLKKELSPLIPQQAKEVSLKDIVPKKFGEPVLFVTKIDQDVYHGEIILNGKKLTKFMFRPLPSIGLIIMSTFELYDIEQVVKEPKVKQKDISEEIDRIIENRLRLQDTIEKAVEKKLNEKAQVEAAVKAQVDATSQAQKNSNLDTIESFNSAGQVQVNGKSKLQDFLDKKKKIEKKEEITFYFGKNETSECPDCAQEIFKEGKFKSCICFGDQKSKKVYVAKSEDGYQVKLSKGWDEENAMLLLETLNKRKQNGQK